MTNTLRALRALSIPRFPFRNGQTYIIPTRFGLIYFSLFALMLLIGATYQNNLVFVFAFIVFGIGNIAMVQTNNNLSRFKIESLQIPSDFTGEKVDLALWVTNPRQKSFYMLSFYVAGQKIEIEKVSTDSSSVLRGKFLLGKRGFYRIDRVRVESVFPYGLFVAWQWHTVQTEYHSYPAPEGEQRPEVQFLGLGEDFSGHRDFREGDSLRNVNWKAVAKGRTKLIKEFRDGSPSSCLFSLDQVKASDLESRLSQMSQWLLFAFESKWDFGVSTGKATIPMGTGKEHLHRCLKEISTLKAA